MKHSGVEIAPKPPVDDIYGAKGAVKNKKNTMNVYSNNVEVEKLKAELQKLKSQLNDFKNVKDEKTELEM